VIDGPFTETKELIAGFWLWQVRSMEEAIDGQARSVDGGTEIEVRRVFERKTSALRPLPDQGAGAASARGAAEEGSEAVVAARSALRRLQLTHRKGTNT